MYQYADLPLPDLLDCSHLTKHLPNHHTHIYATKELSSNIQNKPDKIQRFNGEIRVEQSSFLLRLYRIDRNLKSLDPLQMRLVLVILTSLSVN